VQDVLFIQLAREPVPGLVKTRMLPELSPEQACELHRELVFWTSGILTRAGLGTVELSVAGNAGSPLFQQCQALGVSAVHRQRGIELGERMHEALAHGLERFSKVILVGSDSPQIDRDYLQLAVEQLDQGEVVLGPAADGGYVLIGVTSLDKHWFEAMEWGVDTVYDETVKRLEATNTRWNPLPVLQDIDRPEDLPVWREVVSNAL
jgi:uncharacterized protein